jgi:hypothetical protein
MRGRKWTAKSRAKFLAVLAKTCDVSRAARLAGMHRASAYRYRADNPEFASDWDEAVEAANDALEAELRRRAEKGCKRPVFYKGVKCGEIKEYSDVLGMFILKRYRPEFRDNAPPETNKLSLADLVAEAEQRAEQRINEREHE